MFTARYFNVWCQEAFTLSVMHSTQAQLGDVLALPSPESPSLCFGEKDFSWTPCVFALIGQETLMTPKDECACPLLLSIGTGRCLPDLLVPVYHMKSKHSLLCCHTVQNF